MVLDFPSAVCINYNVGYIQRMKNKISLVVSIFQEINKIIYYSQKLRDQKISKTV